jgi:hypothetical protein
MARTVVGWVFIVAVIAGAGVAVYHERHSFEASLPRIGGWPVAASLVCGLVGVGATMPLWRGVLRGLGVRLPWLVGARVFFLSQLGKYLPGSVWPVLAQMEMGRAHGASRRHILGANVIAIALNCCVGLLVACAVLPAYDPKTLVDYWWVLLVIPFLLIALHPRALGAVVSAGLRLLRRPPVQWRLDARAELAAAGWSMVSWVTLGAQVWVLCAALGHASPEVFLLSWGAMALAVPLGLLFVPAPAGAGVRDVVLGLVLATVLTSGQAVTVVVASRAVLVACDLVLAGLAAVAGRVGRVPQGSLGDSVQARRPSATHPMPPGQIF